MQAALRLIARRDRSAAEIRAELDRRGTAKRIVAARYFGGSATSAISMTAGLPPSACSYGSSGGSARSGSSIDLARCRIDAQTIDASDRPTSARSDGARARSSRAIRRLGRARRAAADADDPLVLAGRGFRARSSKNGANPGATIDDDGAGPAMKRQRDPQELPRFLPRARARHRAERARSCPRTTRRCSSPTPGMVQFKQVFLGKETRADPRAADAQKCLRISRQAQRPRGGGARHLPPHVLRDARELVVRRLLQARGDRLGLGAPDRGLEAAEGQALGDRLHDRRRGRAALAEGHRHRPRPRSCASTQGQLLGDGRDRARAARARRSTSTAAPAACDQQRRAGARLRGERRLRALHRALEPRLHPVQPRRGRRAHASCRRSTSTPAWASSASTAVLQGVAGNYDTDLLRAHHRASPRSSRARRYGADARATTSRSA